MGNELFPDVPISLEKASKEEIQELISQHKEIGLKIAENDPSLAEQMQALGAEGVIDQLEKGVRQVELLTAELEGREEAEANFKSQTAEKLKAMGVEPKAEEEDGGGDGDETEAKKEEAEEPVEVKAEAEEVETEVEEVIETEVETPAGDRELVTASVKPLRLPMPKATRDREPVAVEAPTGGAIVASAGLNGYRGGEVMDRMEMARAMKGLRDQRVATPEGQQALAIVASIKYDFPEERKLYVGDFTGNQEKIDNITSPEALVASGGLCAPVTPYYELAQIATQARPVRDALAGFNAERGGINFGAPPTIADVTTAVGIVTEEEDSEGGTFAAKTCQVVECPPFSEVDVDIIFHCVQFGNLGSRAFPEQVAQFNELVMAAHARVAEINLLDGISAASTQVTAATAAHGYGGLSGLTSEILTAAAGMRSRHRMPADSNLRVILPAWAKDFIRSDVINSQFHRFELASDNDLAAFFRERNINVSWTLDGETGDAQIYGAQGAGALLPFPDTLVWYIFPEGSWLFVDGGTLELGIVRDSVLNSTNDYQIFGESFENIAFIGVESLKVTSTICPTGATAGPGTLITC